MSVVLTKAQAQALAENLIIQWKRESPAGGLVMLRNRIASLLLIVAEAARK